MPVSVPKDIEDEANSYFQRIYNLAPHHSLSIDEVLEMLKRFQESPVKRERVNFNLKLLLFANQMLLILDKTLVFHFIFTSSRYLKVGLHAS